MSDLTVERRVTANDAVPSAAVTTVDQQAFRDAMAKLSAAVNIVTTDGPAGKAGFTASAVSSVSDTPGTLLVCLNRGSSVYPTFQANEHLCVNTLAAHHEALSSLFGSRSSTEERFAATAWDVLHTGSPVLQDALVAFDCRVEEVVSAATHDIFICRVLAIKQGQSTDGLVYFSRGYHAVRG
ncbi:flavin reductase [Pectobacterium parmentieri]|uniref:FMN reductase n=1 Tax=Pectobacterium parmentieri TaxID=1905730 RepID=A0A8B3FC92_PECPM|nr:flavin reductase [Pectobacterium parmentieri]AOR58498.1 FMN reductase [Pectobacterium parmentieri]AYH10497.1 FMN reductase [Pectobacterium parmentieri]AYH18792.1 FMN reductase [Pectobacterium parmentieri]AYH36779.1 FMN reductase [Pectobacterium parmentieri]AZS57011.1 FMN reductase [Pectobacterium parmentieri]